MIKKRIVAVVPVLNNIVVQSFKFNRYLPIGKLEVTLEFLSRWGIDEIIILDISKDKSLPLFHNLQNHIKNCFVPITYGGGLNSLDNVKKVFNKGADKVSFNSSFTKNKKLITETSKLYGEQSVVISLDYSYDQSYQPYVYDYMNNKKTNISLYQSIEDSISLGAGEILLNNIDKDGQYNGFDLNLIYLQKKYKTPLIFAGGARTSKHFLDAFNNGADSLAAGNLFHFTEHSVSKLKSNLSNLNVRKNPSFNYENHQVDNLQRVQKLDDDLLDNMLYTKIEDENI
tara:strand:+ start:1321 stop:2175 length:855 start_codon:yes stop_codon:yes gene_type:complete